MRHVISQRWLSRGLVVGALALVMGCPADNGTQPGTLTLTVSPTSATVQQGGTAATTATATSGNGFSGTVTFAVTGAPAGVTAAVTNVMAAGSTTTATVTFQVAVSTVPGVYTLTVRAQGTGVADGTAAYVLTVTATPNYALSLVPAALTIAPGGNSATAVTITRTNFTDAVTLSLGGAPAGVTGAFVPAAPTGTTSTLTVTVGGAVAPGTYNLTVDGTATPGDRSTPLTLTVAQTPDYTLSLAPAALSIVAGAHDNSTVTITRTNFTGAVTLSVGSAPIGVTGVFFPAAPTGTTSTLTLSVGTAVTPGTYELTVDGTGTAGNRSTPLTLTVTAPPPDYTLAVAPTTLTIGQGNGDNSAVTITRTNFTGAVTLSLGNAPAGVTGVFAPAAPTGTTATLTLSVGAAVPAGTYDLTVDGTATAGNRSTPLTLTVTDAPNYALSLTPAALTIVQNTTDSTDVTITRTNFTDAVTLSLGGAPAGVTGAFAPAAPTGTTSKLTVTVGAAVAPGTYNLMVDGTGAPGARSTALTLTVTAAANYTLSSAPTSLTIAQGANDNTTVTITRTNFAGAVTLSLSGAPAGVTGVFAPAAPTGTSSTLTVSVGAAVAPGTYNLTVDGTGTPGVRSTPLTLTVTGGGGSGNVTLDFSACDVADRPVWLASQDGGGSWVRVTGVNNVYQFNIASGTGGVAYVVLGAGNSSEMLVQYMTQAELTAGAFTVCGAPPISRTITGTAANVALTEAAQVSLGGGTALVFGFGSLAFTMTDVSDGTHDLVGFKSDVTTPGSERGLLRRDVVVAGNGSVGTVDFAGTESFAAASATITVAGLVGGETLLQIPAYLTGATCESASLGLPGNAGSSFTTYGIPAGSQRVTDFHRLGVSASIGTDARSVTESFHTLAARTLTLGASLPNPGIVSLPGPYKRLQATFTLPSDYQSTTGFTYVGNANDKAVSIFATFAYLGGSSVVLALADYTGVAGWDPNWAPTSATTGDWSIFGSSALGGSLCVENARFRSASRGGTF